MDARVDSRAERLDFAGWRATRHLGAQRNEIQIRTQSIKDIPRNFFYKKGTYLLLNPSAGLKSKILKLVKHTS